MGTETVQAVDAMRAAATAARNDEILEVTMFVFELLAERAENALELAFDANDRDALNEVYVFAARADELTPWSSLDGPNRARAAVRRIRQVKEEALAEIESARASTAGPEPVRPLKKEKRPVRIDVASVDDAKLLEAIRTAIRMQADLLAKRGFEDRPVDVGAREIARVLAGEKKNTGRLVVVDAGDVIRVGQRLGKLAREGQLKVTSKPYERHRSYAVEGDDA